MNGKGKIYYKNGNLSYEGDFLDNKAEGYGKMIYEDGEYYIGEFKNGKLNGNGKMYYKKGNLKYEGNYVDGKMEGYGKYIFENGEYYIGEFKNDKKMEKVKNSIKMEIFNMKGIILMTKWKDMENSYLKMMIML